MPRFDTWQDLTEVILNGFVCRLGLLWSLPLGGKVMKNMSNNSQWNMTMMSCPLWKILLYPLHMVEIEPKGRIFWLLFLPHSLHVTSRWDILKQKFLNAYCWVVSHDLIAPGAIEMCADHLLACLDWIHPQTSQPAYHFLALWFLFSCVCFVEQILCKV